MCDHGSDSSCCEQLPAWLKRALQRPNQPMRLAGGTPADLAQVRVMDLPPATVAAALCICLCVLCAVCCVLCARAVRAAGCC